MVDYRAVLKRFSYSDDTKIGERIAVCEKENYREIEDIINEIILWKLNRQPCITKDVIDSIFCLEKLETIMMAVESDLVKDALEKLLKSKGIQLPMASTILHFYYPNIFPIFDQRAYRELYGYDYSGTTKKSDKLVGLYLKYMIDCYKYQQSKCPEIPFSKIDKVLYQLDKEKGNKVRY